MKEWAAKIGPARLVGPSKKKTRKKKMTHQIRPISGRERLHGVLYRDDGGGADQLSHPFCNLAGLKRLHKLLARVPDFGEIA